MARTRPKKRVLVSQPVELEKVNEENVGENQEPNQLSEDAEDPTPQKQVRVTKKKAQRVTRNPELVRTTRASSRANLTKSDSVPTPPPPPPSAPEQPRPASVVPAVIISGDLSESSDDDDATQPELIIPRLTINPDGTFVTAKESMVILSPDSTEVVKKLTAPKITYQPDSITNTPESINVSTEQVRDYMSPNDALSSSNIYATLGDLSPQIHTSKGRLDDSPPQLTQRASSTFQSITASANQSFEPITNFGIIYYFLKTQDEDENTDTMKKAYFCLLSRGLNVTWITASDIESLQDNESVSFYFVLPEFEGPLFEKLKNHPKWKVFLPIGLLNYHSLPTPVRDFPVMDFSMRNCYITVSGFHREVRKNLEDKMRYMSGQISSSIKERTTHVVALDWNTEKCFYVRTHGGYPLVMRPDWVEFCWENLDEAIDALELSYKRVWRLPIFAGFVISGANLPPRGQERLCSLVSENGGIYQNIIDPFRTTHLLTIKREGPNYEKALENERIKIVQPDWIHESIARGYPIPENDIAMRKIANRMLGKFMDFMGMTSSIFSESFTPLESSFSASQGDVRVPGSPEMSEDESVEEES